MTLLFPLAPVTGELFLAQNNVTYQWDGAKWHTQIVPSYANTGSNPGDTPPPNPTAGTFWWDSDSGVLYTWYTDVDSSQWMPATVFPTVTDSAGNTVTSASLAASGVSSGTQQLYFELEGYPTYDGTVLYDHPMYLETGTEVTTSGNLVTSFPVKVIVKTSSHPSYGNGDAEGFTLNNIEGAAITMVYDRIYKFDQSDASNAGHLIKIYTDAAATTEYTTGVTFNGTPGTAGAYTQISTPVQTAAGNINLHYQSSTNSRMGGTIMIENAT